MNTGNRQGRLTIVGAGLQPGQMTLEAESHIRAADVVLLILPTALAAHHVIGLNDNFINLLDLYENRTRPETYKAMADAIVEQVHQGRNTCVVAYGHPGVFVTPTHAVMRQLQEEGYPVRMLPGISAEACLIADLGVDPAEHGWQSFEATSFLFTQQSIAPTAALILWQVGLTGEVSLKRFVPGERGIDALITCLQQWYPAEHRVCIYEAPVSPLEQARKEWVALDQLDKVQFKEYSTLYVPPVRRATLIDSRLEWLALKKNDLKGFEAVPAAPLSPWQNNN